MNYFLCFTLLLYKFDKFSKLRKKQKRMKYIIRLVLAAVAVYLGIKLYNDIQEPIIFQKESDKRYAVTQDRLVLIKDAQLAFKEGNKRFAKNFNELVAHIDTADYVLTSKRDTVFIAFDEVYKEKVEKVETLIDTLGYVSIKDSLFEKGFDLNSLSVVPVKEANNAKFVMKAGLLQKGNNSIPVMEVSVEKEVLLNGLNSRLIENDGKSLKIGSMDEVNLNGNW